MPSLVQTAEALNSGNQIAVTLPGASTTGNGYTILVSWRSSTGGTGITGWSITGESAPTAQASPFVISSTGETKQLFKITSGSSGSTKTFTVTFQASVVGCMRVIEWSGQSTSDIIDAYITNTGTTDPLTCSLTTVAASCSAVAWGDTDGGTPGRPTGWDGDLTMTSHDWFQQASYILNIGAAGAHTINMAQAGTHFWGIMAFSVAPSGGGGGGGTTTTKTMTESLTLTEAQVRKLIRGRLSIDSLSITDDPSRTIQMQMNDQSIDLTDGLIEWRRLARVPADTLTLLDGTIKTLIGGGIIYARVMSETITLSDGFIEWRRLKRLIEDNIDLLDGFAKLVAGAGIIYTKVLSDAVMLIDLAGNRWVYRKAQLSDAINLSDELKRALAHITILGENIEVSDGAVRFLRAVRIPEDSISLADDAIQVRQFDQLYTVNLVFGVTDPFRFGGS